MAARISILLAGFSAVAGLVYAAGIFLIPWTDAADKAILAAINPDTYAPGFDQFFRAINDYTNALILLPLLSWLIAHGLYRLFPRYKRVVTGLLAAETVIIALCAALGKLWPNKTYTGVNVLEALWFLAALGLLTFFFHALQSPAIRRFSCAIGLAFLSGSMTDFIATRTIKDAVARPRPLNDANKPWNEKVRIIPDEVLRGRNSFPSGHMSGTFALLTPLFWYARDRRVRAGLLTWATLQGVGRVYTAAHFPFCVLMGGILGFSVGTLVFFTLGGPSLWPRPEDAPAG
jgi:membrane-associated phospholipid phosphatase